MSEEDKMTKAELEQPTSDEKIMAGFSYLAGWIPALIFWSLKRNESKYIRFHAMQVILFSAVLIVISISYLFIQLVFVPILIAGSLLGVFALSVEANTVQQDPALILPILTGGIVLLSIFLTVLVYFPILILQGINLGAAVAGFTGRDWRYPFLASWAEKINAKDQARQSQRNVP